jgi:hypothetical protein
MTRRRLISGVGVLALLLGSMPGIASAEPPGAGADKASEVRADLDGRPLDPGRAGDFYCHDFDYPAIHCFSEAATLEDAVAPAVEAAAAAGVDYVVVFDYTWFAGSYMYISQDYTALVFLGWNDRISSFMGRNSQRGQFFTDWFYTGTAYYFCCNQQVASLGSYSNTFSSVYRL